jgi:catalase
LDAIYVPCGQQSIETLKMNGDALGFINEAFRHCKPIAASAEGVELIQASAVKGVNIAGQGTNGQMVSDQGVVTSRDASALEQFNGEFIQAIAQHRHWDRMTKKQVPA